jgi:plastocyanin
MEKTATKSGDQQTAPINTVLGNPLRVLITRDGEPVEGVDVDWAAGQGGSLAQEEQSDADGVASVVWTLGPELGNQAATAAIQGADGSPLTYTATATDGTEPPLGPTILVLGPGGGNRFEPNVVTISVGQTVTWSWPEGVVSHNVVPDDGTTPSSSGPPTDGPETYTFTFNEVGIFRFYCVTHGGPDGVGLSGRVLVSAPQP